MNTLWDIAASSVWHSPSLEIICCFLGSPRHQCLRCPLALGCAGKCTYKVLVMARNRRWPLCMSRTSPQFFKRGERWGHQVSLHCIDAERMVVFLRISLQPKVIALGHYEAARPEDTLMEEIQHTIRHKLRLGYYPTSNCTLSYLEKTAITAALQGEVELSTLHIGGSPKVLRTVCRFRRPHMQLRLLRSALGGRFYCYFCLSDDTRVGCDVCRKNTCRDCAFSGPEGSKVCLGCAFGEHDALLSHRTRGDRIRKDWFVGS